MLDIALDFLTSQPTENLSNNFWVFLWIEVPRFTVGTVAILFPILMNFKKFKKPSPPVKAHFLSVIVPTHNDSDALQSTLLSLREQIDVHLQIIVVNDGSTDHTHSFCLSLVEKKFIDHYVHLQSRGGKASAMNAGLVFARYDHVLATDADTTFDRDALTIACEYFEDPKVGAVAGNLRVRNLEHNIVTRMQQINYSMGITIGRLVKDPLGLFLIASGAFGLFKTAAIRQVGGWDCGPGDDADMTMRLRLAGYRVRFAPFATAMTIVPDSLTRLARQRLRWDRSMIRVKWRKYRWPVLNPFRKNFDLALALGSFDIFFFQGLVPYFLIVYSLMLIAVYGEFALAIMLGLKIFYIGLDMLKFLLSISVSSRRKEDFKLLPYVPIYSLVNLYLLHVVLFFSTTNELLFRGSYTDPFVPKKVRNMITRY